MSTGLTRVWERLPLKKQAAQSGIRVFSQQPDVEDEEGKQILNKSSKCLFPCFPRVPSAEPTYRKAAVPATTGS